MNDEKFKKIKHMLIKAGVKVELEEDLELKKKYKKEYDRLNEVFKEAVRRRSFQKTGGNR